MANDYGIDDIKQKDTIAFKTINPYDNNEWRGVVVGFGTYDLVSQQYDLLPYYQEVRKTTSGSNMAEIEDLNYIIVDCYENALTKTTNRRIFAKEWIDASSLRQINIFQHLDIRIFGATDTDSKKILNMLLDYGYSAALLDNGQVNQNSYEHNTNIDNG